MGANAIPICLWIDPPRIHFSSLVAVQASGHDVVRSISAAEAPLYEVFCRALKTSSLQRFIAMQLHHLFREAQPHRIATVEASTTLALES